MTIYPLEAYFGPLSALAIFTVIVSRSGLFNKKVRNLFLFEILILVLLIFGSWIDYELSQATGSDWVWRLRAFTTFINFGLSPFPAMILVLIYRINGESLRRKLFYVPALANLGLSGISVFNGIIFYISSENIYTRGDLFIIPFAASIFYVFSLMYYASGPKTKLNKILETLLVAIIMLVILIANAIEIVGDTYFLVWGVTALCVILYYLFLAIQVILYDPLTGSLNRVAYSRHLGRIDGSRDCTIAMIDLDNLKAINDVLGHEFGDKAIRNITRTIDNAKLSSMRLYRYGGDEFVLIGDCDCYKKMEEVLETARLTCGNIEGIELSFSYGIAQYSVGDDLHKVIAEADEMMYKNKAGNNHRR